MPDNITYVWDGYSEKFNCYFVKEMKGLSNTYIFRAYIKGNKVTLYPHKAMYTTNYKRDKIELSIFDIKQGA